ncbi:MAG: GNAT family N-acetyltransferase, partial [Acidobacteria bacterium]|nr:GNAT family N-acetyltransferase [Acidobacteriota bacterium]
MEWIPSKEEHLEELASWFQDVDSCRQWGGPNFRFPFSAETFRADLRWGEMASWSLCEDGRLAAFGQYYERRGRCHLARLAVAPADRGRGLGTLLVEELSRRGLRELGLE